MSENEENKVDVPKRWWLYVLKLEGDKYYVGITSRSVEERFAEHFSGFAGAAWTHLHKPVAIFYQKNLGHTTFARAELYEKRVTRKYIRKYGLNNVRGGDLNKTEDYSYRIGRFFLKDDWQALCTILFLMFVIAYLSIKLYI